MKSVGMPAPSTMHRMVPIPRRQSDRGGTSARDVTVFHHPPRKDSGSVEGAVLAEAVCRPTRRDSGLAARLRERQRYAGEINSSTP